MTEEIQLSDAEKRLLRRVFHRHALPYIAALGLIALFSLSGGTDEVGESEAGETVSSATLPAVDVDALQETQNRAEELLVELEATREKDSADLDAANRQIAALEKRLGATARRLEKVESLARKALEKAATLQVAATTPRATLSEAANAASIRDKLRRLSPKGMLEEPSAAGETISSPAAPASASAQPHFTP